MNYGVSSDEDESDDDEFFEAQEEITVNSETPEEEGGKTGDSNDDGGVEVTAEGVLEATEINLLCTGKPLCIPITQVISKMFLKSCGRRS